jgi:hypothetical protein
VPVGPKTTVTVGRIYFQTIYPGKCEVTHIRFARIELVTAADIGTLEASMHGFLNKSGETVSRIRRRWGIGVFALPVLVAIALVGLVVVHPAQSNWISEVVEAEFSGANLGPETRPAQPSKPPTEIRTVKAF